MRLSNKLFNLISTADSYIDYDEETTCPICKSKISPVYISSSLNTISTASIFNHCRSCNNSFISNYSVEENETKSRTSTRTYYSSELVNSVPCHFQRHMFDKNIIDVSPQFDKIYNQSLSAETSGLDEIAGLGYRKALEFLIKDFSIHMHPDNDAEIKLQPLGQCINNYIDSPQIKTLASRSAWIGNDEAHYLRKQEDRDISDMKKFIQAIVYFIGMSLITEDAETITPK